MKQILKHTQYHIYWDEINKSVYVKDNLKVRHLNELRYLLIRNHFYYNNIIIGIHYNGEW